MVTMRLPNSTPMVKSCTRWNRLSVNCNNRQDLPTPAKAEKKRGKKEKHVIIIIIISSSSSSSSSSIFASFE